MKSLNNIIIIPPAIVVIVLLSAFYLIQVLLDFISTCTRWVTAELLKILIELRDIIIGEDNLK